MSITALFFALMAQPVQAARVYSTTTVETVDYVPVGNDDDSVSYGIEDEADEAGSGSVERLAPAKPGKSLGTIGPFRVTAPDTVEMDGIVDATTPPQFRSLMAAHPGLRKLVLKDVPGTEDDDANLSLARMVRKAGMETIVPKGGSVRSGGVELFLAGTKRTAETGAEFGVHSWQDDEGREARDYPEGAPIHTAYIAYYTEMGLSPERAKAFYAFTNRSPFDSIHYMTRDEIAQYALTN